MAKKILVIGGVALGPKAASRARRRDPEADITIVERGELFSYAGCGMPFFIEGVVEYVDALLCTPWGARRDERYFENVKEIKLFGKTEALRINRDKQTVTVEDLKTGEIRDLPYDNLVLGVGARPFVPKMEGLGFDGVYRLYDLNDAQAIRRKLDSGIENVAIIGGGLIGMEVCGAFISRGCKVSVFEMMDQLVPALLDKEMASHLEKFLKSKGVEIHTGFPVQGLIGDGNNRLKGVRTADGKEFKADLALVAIGVKPNVDLAKEAGLDIGETGAIAVNEYLQTNDPNIYAGGDCVENTCMVTKEKVYAPMGSTANKHGRVIGDNVTGGNTIFPGITRTVAFKVLDYNIGKTGLNEKEAKTLGYDVVTTLTPRPDCAKYLPESKPFILKLVSESNTGKILGIQAVGTGEAIKRIDVIATALKFGATVKDISDVDLCYAPPYSIAIDAVAHAANVTRNKILGLAKTVSPLELKEKLDRNVDCILLDVRTKPEVDVKAFTNYQYKHIPLGALRNRLEELPKDKEIVVYCKVSVRAWEAQRLLDGKGFKDVKFLDGGLDAWPFEL